MEKMSFYSKKCADVFGKILQIVLIIVIALLIAIRFISLGLKQETWIYLTIIVYILFLNGAAVIKTNPTNKYWKKET